MKNRRIDNKESRTAEFTCFSRALAAHERDERFRGPDYLAEEIIPPLPKLILKFEPVRKLFIQKFIAPGMYEYVTARTKVMDKVFQDALDEHFAQIVFLGAGFDTRALRFSAINHGTRIFELDIATTQQPKIEVFHRKKLSIPDLLCFLPIDFAHEDLHDVLHKGGFVDGEKTLFIWEGVTMYLTAQAVASTLQFIRTCCAAGSRLAFDYIFASVLRHEGRYFGDEEASRLVAGVGESWTFGLEEGEITGFLEERGFEVTMHYTPAELEKAFLTTDDGVLFGRINGSHCIALASVK